LTLEWAVSGRFAEMSLKRGNFGEPANVPLSAGKAGAEIGAHQFHCEFGTDDATSEAEDIDIVVFDRLPRREGVMAGGGADSAEFVGCHASARAAAADQDGAFGRARKDRVRNRSGVVRIVHRIRGIGSEVDELMTFAAQFFNYPPLEHKTRMVARYGYFHRSPSIAHGCSL
jgi:hypothetical protein